MALPLLETFKIFVSLTTELVHGVVCLLATQAFDSSQHKWRVPNCNRVVREVPSFLDKNQCLFSCELLNCVS